MKLGAFGWALHVPRSNNPNRESKIRPCVVVMERNGRFGVVFGRSEPQPGRRCEPISNQSAIAKRWGLHGTTYFHAEIELLPPGFDYKGFFVTELGDGSEADRDDVREYDLWLKIRALANPR